MKQAPTEIEEKAEQLYDYVMRFIKEHYKYSEIKQFLMDDGMDEATAKAIIANVLLLEKKKAKEQIKLGAILVAVGIVISILSYIVPVSMFNQKYHLIVHGPVIAGIILMARGYSKSK
jgi:hypothetical protein